MKKLFLLFTVIFLVNFTTIFAQNIRQDQIRGLPEALDSLRNRSGYPVPPIFRAFLTGINGPGAQWHSRSDFKDSINVYGVSPEEFFPASVVDGTTDVSSAVEEAIDSAIARELPLVLRQRDYYVPTLTYDTTNVISGLKYIYGNPGNRLIGNVTRGLVISDSIIIDGVNFKNLRPAILIYGGTTGDTLRNVVIKNCSFTQSGVDQADVIGTQDGTPSFTLQNWQFINNDFDYMERGIKLNVPCLDFIFYNNRFCYFVNSPDHTPTTWNMYAIKIGSQSWDRPSRNVIINNNQIWEWVMNADSPLADNVCNPIAVGQGYNFDISHNTIRDFTQNSYTDGEGIKFELRYSLIDKNIIYKAASGEAGISSKDPANSYENTISNNIIYADNSFLISGIYSASNAEIINNHITIVNDTVDAKGIRINNSQDTSIVNNKATIKGNIIKSDGYYGIWVIEADSGFVDINNNFVDITGGSRSDGNGILVQGANSISSDNSEVIQQVDVYKNTVIQDKPGAMLQMSDSVRVFNADHNWFYPKDSTEKVIWQNVDALKSFIEFNYILLDTSYEGTPIQISASELASTHKNTIDNHGDVASFFSFDDANSPDNIIMDGDIVYLYSDQVDTPDRFAVINANTSVNGTFKNIQIIGDSLTTFLRVFAMTSLDLSENHIESALTNFVDGASQTVTTLYNRNNILDDLITNMYLNSTATTLIEYRNHGYLTTNSGTVTLSNGQTTKVVTHGLAITPSINDISVTAIETLNNASFWFISTVTSTQFTINVNADPGQDVDFVWQITE